MAKTGLLMIGLGIVAWYWAGGQLEALGSYPAGVDPIEAFRTYPAARMETLKYAGAGLAALGAILCILPSGRR